jgi:hypothetical protein
MREAVEHLGDHDADRAVDRGRRTASPSGSPGCRTGRSARSPAAATAPGSGSAPAPGTGPASGMHCASAHRRRVKASGSTMAVVSERDLNRLLPTDCEQRRCREILKRSWPGRRTRRRWFSKLLDSSDHSGRPTVTSSHRISRRRRRASAGRRATGRARTGRSREAHAQLKNAEPGGEDPEPVGGQGDVELRAGCRRRGHASGCWRSRPSAATSAAASRARKVARQNAPTKSSSPTSTGTRLAMSVGRSRTLTSSGRMQRRAPSAGCEAVLGRTRQRSTPATRTLSGAITVPARKFMEPTKSATKAVAGSAVDLLRRADLLDHAVVHHHDAVGHGQRLFLVVRHHDGGDAERRCSALISWRRRSAHLGIERRQRLVEQQQAGRRRQRARQRHALLLAAGELGRILRACIGQADHRQQLADARLAIARRASAGGSPARSRRCRPRSGWGTARRTGRRCRSRAARAAAPRCRGPPADRAGRLRIEPGDRAQQRGLAAARGPEEADELALDDVERDVAES